MRPPEHDNTSNNKPPVRRRDYSLFFFEQQGNRSYLRFTPLGVTVVMLLIVVPLILILILFWINSRQIENINTNVRIPVQTSTPSSDNKPLIKMAPPLPSPPRIRQQPMNVPNPLRELPIVNSNEQLRPQPKPIATPPNLSRSANYQ